MGNDLSTREFSPKKGVQRMCQSCIDIDIEIENHRKRLQGKVDQAEVERIEALITKLYADRVRLHKNPEK